MVCEKQNRSRFESTTEKKTRAKKNSTTELRLNTEWIELLAVSFVILKCEMFINWK